MTLSHANATRQPSRSPSLPRPSPPSPLTGLTLKSRFVSPQTLLPTPRGSPTLATSNCPDNGIRDTSPVGPSLGTTHRRTRILHSILHLPAIPYPFLSTVAVPFRLALAVARIETVRVLVCNTRLASAKETSENPLDAIDRFPFPLRSCAAASNLSLRLLRTPFRAFSFSRGRGLSLLSFPLAPSLSLRDREPASDLRTTPNSQACTYHPRYSTFKYG